MHINLDYKHARSWRPNRPDNRPTMLDHVKLGLMCAGAGVSIILYCVAAWAQAGLL